MSNFSGEMTLQIISCVKLFDPIIILIIIIIPMQHCGVLISNSVLIYVLFVFQPPLVTSQPKLSNQFDHHVSHGNSDSEHNNQLVEGSINLVSIIEESDDEPLIKWLEKELELMIILQNFFVTVSHL